MCAEDACPLKAEVGSQFCGRHRWRDEVALGGSDDSEDRDFLTQLRFGFPTANAIVTRLLQSELTLREALLVVLEEYYQPLLQHVQRQSTGRASTQLQADFRAIFAPFERCYAVSASVCRDLLRLSNHSMMLPLAGQTLLHTSSSFALYTVESWTFSILSTPCGR